MQTRKQAVSVAQALELLAAIGIRWRPGVSDADLLLSLGGNLECQPATTSAHGATRPTHCFKSS